MNYASQSRRPNPAALAGALGIPAAVGALLVVGLAVTVAVRPPPPLAGFTVTPTPIPPHPPTDPVEQKTSSKQQATTTIPNRPEVIPFDLGSTPIGTLPGVDELTGPVVGPVDFGIPGPPPSASPFDPVGARPKNNPGRWVVDNDYRPSWLRQGLLGNASFTLVINATGRVSSCTITRSTGHSALDAATCELVTKRARFDAARDGTGRPVAGNFSGSITWNIPD